MLFDLLALFSLIVVLLLLKRLVNIFPSLMACMMRGKENLNLESSVKLARDRDVLALSMVLPFCLLAAKHNLYEPTFMADMERNVMLGVYICIFLAYLLVRSLAIWLFRPNRMPKKTYHAADKAALTFFIIMTLVLFAAAGIMNFLDMDENVLRNAMLWVSAVIYGLFLLRKIQIFSSSCSVFAAFLYLCALELIPTGILVVSAMIF